MGCKRTLLSNDYYPAVASSNVHINTTGVERITETAVVDAAGVSHDVDAIILGTGFKTDRLPIGLGHTSVIMMLESQMRYVTAAISYAGRRGDAVSPTAGAQKRFVDLVARLGRGTVWTAGGCSSWYLDSTGRNSNIWPGFVLGFRRRARHFVAADHEVSTLPLSEADRLTDQEA